MSDAEIELDTGWSWEAIKTYRLHALRLAALATAGGLRLDDVIVTHDGEETRLLRRRDFAEEMRAAGMLKVAKSCLAHPLRPGQLLFYASTEYSAGFMTIDAHLPERPELSPLARVLAATSAHHAPAPLSAPIEALL